MVALEVLKRYSVDLYEAEADLAELDEMRASLTELFTVFNPRAMVR